MGSRTYRLLKDWMIPCGYALAAIGLVFMLKMDTTIWGIYICAFFIAFATSIAHSTIYSKALNYVPDSIVAILVFVINKPKNANDV